MEVEKSFSHTATNRLNKAHRPQYLLSGILECARCFGPYAIMAKDRYGCTDRQKKLPIDDLGGIVCTNSKTISRFELEERVVSAVPDSLLGADNLERINRDIKSAIAWPITRDGGARTATWREQHNRDKAKGNRREDRRASDGWARRHPCP